MSHAPKMLCTLQAGTRCCKPEWRTHVPGLYLTSNLALMLSQKGKVRENCYLFPTNWVDKRSPVTLVGKEVCLFKVSQLTLAMLLLRRSGLRSSECCRADRSWGHDPCRSVANMWGKGPFLPTCIQAASDYRALALGFSLSVAAKGRSAE